MVRRFEEISNNAWPALQILQYDGWLLRFANGVTKRSNSVNLLYPSSLDPEIKIDFCEKAFSARNIPPTFKITSISDPSDMDQRLGQRGYFIHSIISFQVADLKDFKVEGRNDVSVSSKMNEAWIDDFIRMNQFELSRKPTYIAIMNQVVTPKCLVSISEKGKTIGVGLGVIEGKFLGLFDLVVDMNFRNRGLGTRLVNALLGWGKIQGAETAYLQVLNDNFQALRLYEKPGFKEIYTYWYRMKGLK